MIMKRNLTCTFGRRLAIAAALLALAFVAAPRPGRAQGSRRDDIVIGPRGTPLGGASVAICTQPAVTTTAPCSPLATLYSNAALTQALANPLTTDGLGNYVFYAAPGKYTVQIYGPNITTRVLSDVILPSDPSAPTFSTLTTTSGITAFSLSGRQSHGRRKFRRHRHADRGRRARAFHRAGFAVVLEPAL